MTPKLLHSKKASNCDAKNTMTINDPIEPNDSAIILPKSLVFLISPLNIP